MKTIDYFKNDKRKLYRVIITAYLPYEIGGNKSKKTAEKYHSLNNRIKNELCRSIRYINAKVGNYLRDINVDFFMKDGDIKELTNFTVGTVEKYVRIVIDLVGLNDVRNDFLVERNISHLVNISINKENKGWVYSIESGMTTVTVSEQNICNVIHDIILDIVMFNSYPALVMNYNQSDEQRKYFSEKKHSFVVDSKLGDYYGSIAESKVGYCCFASLCRTGGNLDLDMYINLWDVFTSSIFIKSDISINASDDEMVCDILKNNKRNGQISYAKFRRVVKNLPKGTYLLIMADRRPSRHTDRSRISRIFGCGSWTQSAWVVRQFAYFSVYSRYSPFVSFYKFDRK